MHPPRLRSGIRRLKLGSTNLKETKEHLVQGRYLTRVFDFLSLARLIEFIVFVWNKLQFHLRILFSRKERGLR